MFDEVRCSRILPDGFDGNGVVFQTKDFACNLDSIEITDGGKLTKRDRDEEGAPAVELDFHGWLHFYDYSKDKVWREYAAKFTDGQLVEIKTIASGD